MNVEGTVSEKNVDQLAGKYLTFRLTEENYGIEILKIREIFGMTALAGSNKTPAVTGRKGNANKARANPETGV